jgi:hypothetical protein
MSLKIVKKLSNIEWLSMPVGSSVLLTGTIRDMEEGAGTYGRWVRFKGQFAAQFQNAEGEIFTLTAGQMFAPEILESLLESAVCSATKESGDAFEGIEFAFRLKKDAQPKKTDLDRGYKWAVETVQEIETASSPALKMLAQFGQDPRKVAALTNSGSPEPSPEPSPEAVEAPKKTSKK